MSKVKITVLKRLFNQDLIEEYCSLDLSKCTGCPHFQIGQEFIVENHNKVPDKFCSWAWADIQKDVMLIMFGGSQPWTKNNGVAITCCTDGYMPVIFKVEKMEQKN